MCQYLQLDDALGRECAKFLSERVDKGSVESLLNIWNFAEQFHFQDLRNAVMRALEFRLDAFMRDGGLLYLGYEEIRKILEHPNICVGNEKDIFTHVMDWCEANRAESDSQSIFMALDLISKIKLSVLHPSYVCSRVRSITSDYQRFGNLTESMKSKETPCSTYVVYWAQGRFRCANVH